LRSTAPAKLKRLGRHKIFDVLGEYLEFGDPFEGHKPRDVVWFRPTSRPAYRGMSRDRPCAPPVAWTLARFKSGVPRL